MASLLTRTFPFSVFAVLYGCGTVDVAVLMVAALLTAWSNYGDDCEDAARTQLVDRTKVETKVE